MKRFSAIEWFISVVIVLIVGACFAPMACAQTFSDPDIVALGPIAIKTAAGNTPAPNVYVGGSPSSRKCNGAVLFARKPFRFKLIHDSLSAASNDTLISVPVDTTLGNRGAAGASGNYGVEFPCTVTIKDKNILRLRLPAVTASDTVFVKWFYWEK